MRVRVLGGLAVDGIAERDLGSRKGRTLVKLLTLARGAPVPVDRIAEVLWADAPPLRPADQVGVLVSRLRGVLGADRIPRSDAGYALVVDWLDLDELAARSAEAGAALASGRHGAARAAAEAALALARGPVLPDEDGDWLAADRAAADRAVAHAGIVAASAALAAGDADAAVVAATAALGRDPYDEGALRALMAAHAAAGRPASALAAYSATKERLAEDLGVSPTAATEALHDEILLAEDEPAPAPAPTPTPDLLGRADELAALAIASRRPPGIVALVGEAGIGKSTIARAFAAGFDGTVLWGRCDELGRDLPLQPVVDAVVAAGGDDVVGALGLGDATIVRAAEAGQAELFAALLDAVHRTGAGPRPGPLLLVVEDLHLAAAGTLAWLAFARRRSDRLLVLTMSRPPAPDLPGAAVIPVGPLDHAAAVALAGTDDPDVLARGAGNPLFLRALAAAPSGPLPESVRDALVPPVAASVRTAACLGEDVDLDLLAEVLARPAIEVLGELEDAARAGVLDERGAGFAFHHALVREALEQAAGAARRAFAHREAARVLADRPQHDPLAVAIHARLGGATELAVDAYVRAAAIAAARFDAAAAIEHLDAALALTPSAAALSARARVRMSLLDHDRAAEDAEAAVALGGSAAALETAAWVAYYQRRHDDALAAADAALARAGDDAALRSSCLAVAGRVRHGRGDLAGAVDRFTASAGAPPAVQGVVDVWLAHARLHQGRPADALGAVDRALLDGTDLAHPWAAIHGRFARIMALGQAGRLADALAACDRMDAHIADAGAVGSRFVAVAFNLRSWVLRSCGRVDEAIEANESAVLVAGDETGRRPSAEGFAEGFWVAHLDAAEAAFIGGDDELAASWIDRAAPIDDWQGTMAWHQRQRLDLQRARLALLDGDADEAAALATAVVDDAVTRGSDRYRWLAAAWSAVATGRPVDDEVVAGLSACAPLEAWPLLDRLGRRAEASALAARVVAGAGPLRAAVEAHVASVLG